MDALSMMNAERASSALVTRIKYMINSNLRHRHIGTNQIATRSTPVANQLPLEQPPHDSLAVARDRRRAAALSFVLLHHPFSSRCCRRSCPTASPGTTINKYLFIIGQVQIKQCAGRTAAEHRGAVQPQDAGGTCVAATGYVRWTDRTVASHDVLGAGYPARRTCTR